MRFFIIILAAFAFAFVGAACSSSESESDSNGDDSPVATATDVAPPDATEPIDGDEPTVELAPTAAPEADFSLPGSTVQALLDRTYNTGQSEPPSADQLPFPPGTVVASWYQSEGAYVVHYDGLSLAVTGPLCPGNSIQTVAGFEYVSNAPSGAGACSGATTLVGPPTGVLLCGSEVLYLTAIPVSAEGTLYGTVEVYNPDGSIIGLTSLATADGAATPEIDISSCERVEA